MSTIANDLISITFFSNPVMVTVISQILVSLLLFALVWVISVKKVDVSIVDYFWGGSFLLTLIIGIVMRGAATAATLLILALVWIWALRLTIHMVRRHVFLGREDGRYAAMRAKGGPSFWWKCLLSIFLVQSLVQLIVGLPLILASTVQADTVNLWILAAGLIVALAGLALETIADHQLAVFIRQPENSGRLLTTGLFALSRHPNYFGEVVFWWGIGLIAYETTGLPAVFIGPFVLTGLLLRVSGVSLLDQRHAETKPGYAEWAARTNAFIPWPPRRDRIEDNSDNTATG